MAPDLDTLPPSPSTHSSARGNVSHSSTGSPTNGEISESSPPASRSASISLQAAATMNAGLRHEQPRSTSSSSLSRNAQSQPVNHGRQRSAVLMNLQLNDPTIPAPGEMVQENAGHTTTSPQPLSPNMLLSDPHHQRAPSLGELHQELEAEQEAQVNRLLFMIRQQQLQLQQLQSAQGQGQNPVSGSAAVVDGNVPSMERSNSISNSNTNPSPSPHPTSHQFPSSSIPRSPVLSTHPRGSVDAPRQDLRPSQTLSRGATTSPRSRSTSISGDPAETWLLGGRDESTFYQAETQSLVRENQMLRHRIRELERQLTEAHATAAVTHEPTHASNLLHSSTSAETATPDETTSAAIAAPTISSNTVPAVP